MMILLIETGNGLNHKICNCMKNFSEKTAPEVYLEYVNDWLTVEQMAHHYGIDEMHLNKIIDAGRTINEILAIIKQDGELKTDGHCLDEILVLINGQAEPAAIPTGLYKYLDCSTAHMTLQDNDYLTEIAKYQGEFDVLPEHLADKELIVRDHPYGFWVHVSQEEEEQQAIQDSTRISPSLKQVFLKAQRLGAYWINFDRDAEVHEDLPENDWSVKPKEGIPVRFYVEEEGNILAVFYKEVEKVPTVGTNLTLAAYSPIGQHTSATCEYIRHLTLATPEQYKDLKAELEAYPYQYILNVNPPYRYHVQENIGKARYVVNFSDGTKFNRDGSEFWDVAIFSNKKEMEQFIEELEQQKVNR
jgi:hypothetical protein